MVRRTFDHTVQGMKGGSGSVEIREILPREGLMGHGTLYAHVVVAPHSSIGYHRHVGNTEPYYVLAGEGVFEDDDHTRTPVRAGDVCLIRCGESHAMYNDTDHPLELMALVLNLA